MTFVLIEMLQQLLSQGETVVAFPNMVTLSWHEFKYILVLYSYLYNYLLLYMYCSNATFKIHFFLIFLPCKNHNLHSIFKFYALATQEIVVI